MLVMAWIAMSSGILEDNLFVLFAGVLEGRNSQILVDSGIPSLEMFEFS